MSNAGAGAGAASSSLGTSATVASVVRTGPITAAFWCAVHARNTARRACWQAGPGRQRSSGPTQPLHVTAEDGL